MDHSRAWTLIETVVTIIVAVLVAAIVLVAMGAPRQSRQRVNQLKNATQLRGIHTSAIIYSQSNNGYLPGLDSSGDATDLSPEGRFQVLLDRGYFTGDLLLNPFDDWAVSGRPGASSPRTTPTPRCNSTPKPGALNGAISQMRRRRSTATVVSAPTRPASFETLGPATSPRRRSGYSLTTGSAPSSGATTTWSACSLSGHGLPNPASASVPPPLITSSPKTRLMAPMPS